MLRPLYLASLLALLAVPGVGQELTVVTQFTVAQRHQAEQLVNYPIKYLHRATYYPDGSVATLSYRKGTTTRQHFRTFRDYGFFSDGRLQSRNCRNWLGMRRTKEWNTAGQLVKVYRRNTWGSTSYIYHSRQLIYENSRLARIEIEQVATGCFSSRTLKRKAIAFTPAGHVVSYPSLLSIDSATTQP